MQSWADSFLFLRSRSDSFISPKSNLWKKKKKKSVRLHLHTYGSGCFLVFGAEVVQFFSIKMSIPCIFYSSLNFYLKKGGGDFWRPQFATNTLALGTPWLPELLCKHWFTSSVWNFCHWVADVPPRETSTAARSDEKRLFSQGTIAVAVEKSQYNYCDSDTVFAM